MAINNLIGQVFGKLTVLKDSGLRAHRGVIWECLCECGDIARVSSNHLTQKRTRSCGKLGCYHSQMKDLRNKRFGRLIAIEPIGMKDGTHTYWKCLCDCGKYHEVASNHLVRGSVQSCGCIATSIGESNIESILIKENIQYIKEYSFPDCINIKPLRFDFAIIENFKVIRLVEFDGVQHFKEQTYFTQSLNQYQNNDMIKNEYCKNHNIPLVRIPYWERNNLSIQLILENTYLVNEED